MYELFGEFNSYEEINATAEGLRNEGDTQNILVLAKENGIDEDDALDYIDGVVPEFVNLKMAAMGKLNVEDAELKLKEIMKDWLDYIRMQCMESDEMAAAVRRNNKSLKGCIAELLKWSFSNQIPIPDEIKKASGVNAGRVSMGIPGMATAKRIIREYYLK